MREKLELRDIFRNYGKAYQDKHKLSLQQLKALDAISRCRSASLGGHLDRCDSCNYSQISYNSCRNRHCPKCQSLARERWLEARKAELLPVRYFHLVFTLPYELNQLLRANSSLAYSILIKSASQTVLQLASDPKHLGVKTGLMTVLHTWGQNLMYHPHVHCIVPGGGLALDENKWIHSRSKFFLPVKVMAALFRGKFLHMLKRAFDKNQLSFSGELAVIKEKGRFQKWLSTLYEKNWVVYAKRPFGGPKQVYEYLGRYTHRVAISNHRILSMDKGRVCFKWRDYKDGNKNKQMSLEADEFIRRFLMHILPRGFRKIRYYGLLSPRNRSKDLVKARTILKVKPVKLALLSWQDLLFKLTGVDPDKCPSCEKGRMITEHILLPQRIRAPPTATT